MHLARLRISGYRSIDSADVAFQPGLNVVLGENSGGKSNLLDAVRMVTSPLDGRRELHFGEDDLSRGNSRTCVEISAVYDGEELGPYFTARSHGVGPAVYTVQYQPPAPGRQRGSVSWRSGEGHSDDPDREGAQARRRIRHLYLPALRDAQRDLASRQGTRVHGIIGRFLREDTDRETFLNRMGTEFNAISDIHPLPQAIAAVQEPLTVLTSGARHQQTGLSFGDSSVASIARSLRLLMNEAGIDLVELAESGLGYANLLFIATVLAQLRDAAEADLTLLLVEEPEAHLHPQLQTVLIEHLKQEAASSQQRRPQGDWLGRVQVVVTTHSPHITAACDLGELIIAQRRPQLTADTMPSAPGTGPGEMADVPGAKVKQPQRRLVSTFIPMAGVELDRPTRIKLKNYLNATRNTLLFGPRVLLVEGISEAVLLPAFARQILDALSQRRFNGTALVPIDHVDFEPYVRALLTKIPGCGRIGQRVAIITDGDFSDPRPENLRKVIAGLGAADIAEVFTNESSLEPELIMASPTNAELINEYGKPHRPRYWDKEWKAAHELQPLECKRALRDLIKAAEIRKGQLAQEILILAQKKGTPIDVPDYLQNALRWISADTPTL